MKKIKKIKFNKLNIVWCYGEAWLMTGNPRYGSLYNETFLWVTDELVLGKIELSDEMKDIFYPNLCMDFQIILSTNKLHKKRDTCSILFDSLWIAKEADGSYSLHNSKPSLSSGSSEKRRWNSRLIIGKITPCERDTLEEFKVGLDQLCSDDITEIVTEDNNCEEVDKKDFKMIIGINA